MSFRREHDHGQPLSPGVTTQRLEAFSDGVLVIAITPLALTLQVPELPRTIEAIPLDRGILT